MGTLLAIGGAAAGIYCVVRYCERRNAQEQRIREYNNQRQAMAPNYQYQYYAF